MSANSWPRPPVAPHQLLALADASAKNAGFVYVLPCPTSPLVSVSFISVSADATVYGSASRSTPPSSF